MDHIAFGQAGVPVFKMCVVMALTRWPSTHTWRPPSPPSRTDTTMPRVALSTGVPRLANMSTPAWLRSLPRGAPKVSAMRVACTPSTGTGRVEGGGIRAISQVVRGTAMKGCPQDQAAAQDSSIRISSHHANRFSART